MLSRFSRCISGLKCLNLAQIRLSRMTRRLISSLTDYIIEQLRRMDDYKHVIAVDEGSRKLVIHRKYENGRTELCTQVNLPHQTIGNWILEDDSGLSRGRGHRGRDPGSHECRYCRVQEKPRSPRSAFRHSAVVRGLGSHMRASLSPLRNFRCPALVPDGAGVAGVRRILIFREIACRADSTSTRCPMERAVKGVAEDGHPPGQ